MSTPVRGVGRRRDLPDCHFDCDTPLSVKGPTRFETPILGAKSDARTTSSDLFRAPLSLPGCSWLSHYADLSNSVGQPFSATHFSGHCFRLIPASGSFASSAFPVPPSESFGSLPECSRSLWEQYPLRPRVPQGNGAEMEKQIMYLYVKWNSFARRRFLH
jgi:hypothetical protein